MTSKRNSGTHFALAAAFVLAACGGDDGPDPRLMLPNEQGMAATWAGTHDDRGYTEDGISRLDSLMNFPADLTFGPEGRAWINDWNNHRIRIVEPDDTFRTVVGTDYEGDGDPEQNDEMPRGDPVGALGTTVAMNHPTDIIFMPDDTVLIAAWHNNKIRTMDYASEMVYVLAGDEYGYRGDEGPAHEALFDQPKAVEVDSQGQIYVLDQRNKRIRRINTDEERTIETVAGTGDKDYFGDGGPALEAAFSFDDGATPVPSGALAMRGSELYVADTLNHRIRMVNLDTGMITLIAGTGTAGYEGDGGPALEAAFFGPTDIEFGPDGRLYVADSGNNVIRAIDLDTGMIDRVAGNAQPCSQMIYCYEPEADQTPALEVQFLLPWGIAFDPEGDLYVADTNNQRIVKVDL